MNKVIICQHGNRHQYRIAQAFEAEGMLSALYTDSCEYSFMGKVSKYLSFIPIGNIRRLSKRITNLDKNKVKSTDKPFFAMLVNKKAQPLERFRSGHKSLSKKMIKWGLRDADIVYSMYHESLEFLEYAKENNRKIVVDVFISPAYKKDMYDIFGNESSIQELEDKYLDKTLSLADIILCPSEYVAEGVKRLYPDFESKVKILPYGSSINYNGQINKPVKGRIFWAGGDYKRKGLEYLASAADILKLKYPDMEFRAAGVDDSNVIMSEKFRNINFLGKIDKASMKKEFLSADIFVFPTIAEGMAGTVIEAISAGCPVMTTKSAGIDSLINYENAIIINYNNIDGIASGIEKIYHDRDLRNKISEKSLKISEEYTVYAWQNRLKNLIESL